MDFELESQSHKHAQDNNSVGPVQAHALAPFPAFDMKKIRAIMMSGEDN